MDDRRNFDRGSRREPGRGRERPHEHQPIDYWEDIKNVLERDRDVGRRHLYFKIDMQRPVFVDGSMGYYRLNTFIEIDRKYLQLSTSALAAMANYFHYNRDRILNAIDEVRNMNAKIDKAAEDRATRHDEYRGPDRFEGLDNENGHPEDYEEEGDGEEDYEETTIINEEESPDESGSPSEPSPETQPRRTRRAKD
jgi:hypothetical protein